jgi:YaiO family outer membrane protein
MLPPLAAPVEIAAQVQADPQAQYQTAVADRLAGRHAQAVDRLERILAQHPTDVDARLNLGLSLLALDRIAEAETAFRTVLEQTPAYADAEIGLARVAERRGDRIAARYHVARAASLSPDREDIARLLRSLDEVPWRVDVDVSRSRLSGGLPDWTEARVGASRALAGGWTVGGVVERTERFDRTDVYLEGRLDRRLPRGDVYVALGGTPDADYRPEVILMAGGSASVAPGLRATLDASAGRYVSGSVQSLHPGLTADLFGDRLELAVRWINVWDETDQHRDGYAARATFRLTDRFRLSAGHANAPESSEGVVVDVVATSLGAAFDLTDRVTLRLGAVDEDRGSYGRDEISLGIGWRF